MANPGSDQPLSQLSLRYRVVALTILMLTMTCAWADRTIVSTIGQAIKVDLHLSDAQLGGLNGFAFSISFVVFCLPLARLAERKARPGIIAWCVTIWSIFTSLSGLAGSFLQLLIFRAGVGAAEGGVNPAAYSLISDYFPAEKRASALSIYNLGVPFGTLLGAMLGGVITYEFGWRMAFLFLGLPGIILAILVWLFVREVPRGLSDMLSGRGLQRETAPTIRQTARYLFGFSSARHLLAGLVLQTFVTHGAGAFVAPFFIRAFGLNFAQVGMIIAFAGGLASAIGTFAGGFLADAIAARYGRRWYALIPAIAMATACPFYLIAYNQSSCRLAVIAITIGWMLQYIFFSPLYGAIYTLAEPRMRATTSAIIILLTNVIALLAGAVLVGALIDHFAAGNFSIAGFGSFGATCPGGVAGPAASPAVKLACSAALDQATRKGLTIAALGYGWAAIHFFLAARTIARDLQASRTGMDVA
jgi:predicted MFS family arabinose efflux permease